MQASPAEVVVTVAMLIAVMGGAIAAAWWGLRRRQRGHEGDPDTDEGRRVFFWNRV